MAVTALPEVDLRHRVEPELRRRVDEQRELHAVPARDRQALDELAAHGVLAGQGLGHPCELGPVQVEQGTRDEFGDPAPAHDAPAAIGDERTVVARLDEVDAGLGQDRPEERDDVVGGERSQVGIEEHDDVALRRREAAPHRFALARDRGDIGQDLGRGHDARSRLACHACRRVAAIGVHDDQVVDEGRGTGHELGANGGDDGADRGFLVAGGNDHRDLLIALVRLHASARPVAGGGGPPGEPCPSCRVHDPSLPRLCGPWLPPGQPCSGHQC